MSNGLFKRIYDLKINEIKHNINLHCDEQALVKNELNSIYNKLDLNEISYLKKHATIQLKNVNGLLETYKNINKKIVKSKNKTTIFDAENFYELSTKKLACKEIINDCNNLLEKQENKDLKF